MLNDLNPPVVIYSSERTFHLAMMAAYKPTTRAEMRYEVRTRPFGANDNIVMIQKR